MTQLILETLAKMQQYFGKSITDESIQIYLQELSNLSEADFKTASIKIMREFEPTSTKPFPLIKDFLYYLGRDEKTQAVNIVSHLRKTMERVGQYESIDLGDAALASVVNRYGGWQEMVFNNTDQWWSLHERNFISAYESAKRAGVDCSTMAVGLLEQQNRSNGYTPDILLEHGINPVNCGYSKEEVQELENNIKKIGTNR